MKISHGDNLLCSGVSGYITWGNKSRVLSAPFSRSQWLTESKMSFLLCCKCIYMLIYLGLCSNFLALLLFPANVIMLITKPWCFTVWLGILPSKSYQIWIPSCMWVIYFLCEMHSCNGTSILRWSYQSWPGTVLVLIAFGGNCVWITQILCIEKLYIKMKYLQVL